MQHFSENYWKKRLAKTVFLGEKGTFLFLFPFSPLSVFLGEKGKMARKRAEWGKGKTKSNAGKREKAELQI